MFVRESEIQHRDATPEEVNELAQKQIMELGVLLDGGMLMRKNKEFHVVIEGVAYNISEISSKHEEYQKGA